LKEPDMFSPQRIAVAAFIGAILNVIVAWACIIWAPTIEVVEPMRRPHAIDETIDPHGVRALHWRESGFGWTLSSPCGWRPGDDRSEVIWRGPYGRIYHRSAGWPFPSIWSRVSVLDSQAATRTCEGCPEYEGVAQRVRWELPVGEIVQRGLASKDLPGWCHAQPDRRLPLIPLWPGFVGNTLVYAAFWLLLRATVREARWRLRREQRGFAIQISGSGQASMEQQVSRAV
jgi:hypothetical protein